MVSSELKHIKQHCIDWVGCVYIFRHTGTLPPTPKRGHDLKRSKVGGETHRRELKEEWKRRKWCNHILIKETQLNKAHLRSCLSGVFVCFETASRKLCQQEVIIWWKCTKLNLTLTEGPAHSKNKTQLRCPHRGIETSLGKTSTDFLHPNTGSRAPRPCMTLACMWDCILLC